MNFLAHIIFGVVVFTIAIYLVGYLNSDLQNPVKLYKLFVAYTIAFIASLLPDIDQRQSIIFKTFNLFLAVLLFFYIVSNFGINVETIGLFLVIFSLWYFGVSKIILKHRGFTHGLVFMGLFVLVILFSTRSLLFTAAAFSGFISHLLLDRCIKLW